MSTEPPAGPSTAPRRRRHATLLAPLAPLVLVAAGLTGCEQAAERLTGPDPEPVAEALAAALDDGDLTGLEVESGDPAAAQESYDGVVTGLGGSDPVVTLDRVVQDGDLATVSLTWAWPLAGEEWEYSAQAELALAGDTWRVRWAPAVVEPSLEEGDVLEVLPLSASRGEVVGARGLKLVTERPVSRFGIDRSQVRPARAERSARLLARLVGIDPAPYAARVAAAGEKAFVEAIVWRNNEVPPAAAQGVDAIPGARAIAASQALAPTRGFAAALLGQVGEVTAEMIEEAPDTYEVGDVAGVSGLQARYDDELRGRPGLVVYAVDRDDVDRELFRVEAADGEPLRLTLDADLQSRAEGLLAGIGPASALVAIRPSTGGILAAANGPGAKGLNIATYGQYAPGSTFKTVSTLALLRAGVQPDAAVPCTAEVTVDGKRFTNYSDYPAASLGRIPLRTAVAQSCNTAFVALADRLDDTDLFDAAASLGMGLDHDLGFPAYFGKVEPPESATEKAADMIGQGRILASPMVMATVAASVQRGELVVPRLVEGVEVAAPDGAAPLTPAEAGALQGMLRGVVTEGSGRGLADLPGPPALAKTGTAEFGETGQLRTHAWMIAAQGDVAVAVFVEVGESGSRTAGPVLEEFLRAAASRG